jgi:hypothetical protein
MRIKHYYCLKNKFGLLRFLNRYEIPYQTEDSFEVLGTSVQVSDKEYLFELYEVLWSSIFVTLMANKIGGLQFGIYRNCQISSRVFHTAVAALPLTKANRSDFE